MVKILSIMKILDQSSWKRKEHFDFFSKYDEPYFGIVSEINCTKAYQIAKSRKQSFFSYYLHKSICAVNLVEEMRCRIIRDQIVVYDQIHPATTIGRADGTFAFTFTPFDQDFNIFNNGLQSEINKVKNSSGIRLKEGDSRKDVVHYSTIPWHTFSSLTHARKFKFDETAPKITFGKMFTRDAQQLMNVAIYVHHGLVDGFHIAKHLECFQNLMDENV